MKYHSFDFLLKSYTCVGTPLAVYFNDGVRGGDRDVRDDDARDDHGDGGDRDVHGGGDRDGHDDRDDDVLLQYQVSQIHTGEQQSKKQPRGLQ
ncbi:hypothetical protein NPIL_28141 [Nephila pilipes]|uniref:Uncharacterized protein n=1 Tax=Nephila pilipes TaxID=299642 RepID=A0A8X6PK49_NEPPI|nr:hypothetical protein NPIL_28141 [Nephila pilipes]